MSERFEIDTAVQRAWATTSNLKDAMRCARRINKLHNTMPIAFPLPITVWQVTESADGIHRKRLAALQPRSETP